MKAMVVIPWWPGTTDPWRSRWRDQIVSLWEDRGYPVILAEGIEGAARNRGVETAIEMGADVVICTDADAVITEAAAFVATGMAHADPGLVIPHDRYVYLSWEASKDLSVKEVAGDLAACEGRWPGVESGEGIEAFGPISVGGPAVFSTGTWERAGGYDEGIVRAYDGAFALACGVLVAPQRRLSGDFVHLWHPRPEEEPPGTWAVMKLYHDAAMMGEAAMRNLVERRRR